MIEEGRKRVVIENVMPEIDGGAFPAKRMSGAKENKTVSRKAAKSAEKA